MKIKHNILIIILLAVGFTACSNDETCRKNRYVSMTVAFYKDTINTLNGSTVTLPLTVDSITIHGLKVDSILYKNKKNVTAVNLPLNQFAEESKFVLNSNKINDTLTVRYTNKYEYLSLECGNIRVHHIDTAFVTNHFFYKVIIEDPEVNTSTSNASAKTKNIKIHCLIKR